MNKDVMEITKMLITGAITIAGSYATITANLKDAVDDTVDKAEQRIHGAINDVIAHSDSLDTEQNLRLDSIEMNIDRIPKRPKKVRF